MIVCPNTSPLIVLARLGRLDLFADVQNRLEGRIPLAAPVIRAAIDAGLFLDDSVLRRALAEIGERWPSLSPS